MIIRKSADELQAMRRAGLVVARARELVREMVRPGVTTLQLDQAVEEFFRRENAIPAFKGYHGYPATICASVNEVVVHGIPSADQVLEEGSISQWISGHLWTDSAATVHGLTRRQGSEEVQAC